MNSLSLALTVLLTGLYLYILIVAILMYLSSLGLETARRILDRISKNPDTAPDEKPPKLPKEKRKSVLRVKKLPTRRSYKLVFLFALLSRCVIYIFAYIFYLARNGGKGSFAQISQQIWTHWDAGQYLIIAQKGYINSGEDSTRIVFYPLYPYMMKFLGTILGGAYFFAGMMISLTAFCFACIVLYKLIYDQYGNNAAWRGVLLMGLFPTSFFFAAPFTEALFVFLTLMAYDNARKRKFIVAGVFGALAAFTRNMGILIVIPIFIEAFRHRPNRKELSKAAAGILLPFSGLLAYLGVNYAVTGNMFTFIKVQREHWSQHFEFFPKVLNMIAYHMQTDNFVQAFSLWGVELFMIALALAVLAPGIRYLTPSLAAYSAAYMLIVMSPSWLLSAPRYILPLFPLYIALSRILKSRAAFAACATLFGVLMFVCCGMYAIGWYVM